MTIAASPKMLRAFDNAVRNGRVTGAAYQYAIAQGYSDEYIAQLRDGVRKTVRARNLSLAHAGAPLMRRVVEDPVHPNMPTPEVQAKAGRRLVKKTLGKNGFFQFRSILDQYGGKFDEDRKWALQCFLEDAAMALKIRVADWQPSGGRSPNPIGGLGSVDQDERDAFNRHSWVVKHLSAAGRLTAKALVTNELLRGDGTPLTLEDFGAKVCPDIAHVHRRWGVGMGALWSLAHQLHHLYSMAPARTTAIAHQRGVLT